MTRHRTAMRDWWIRGVIAAGCLSAGHLLAVLALCVFAFASKCAPAVMGVLGVLCFPLGLLGYQVMAKGGDWGVILFLSNSLLWGVALAALYLLARRLQAWLDDDHA